MAKFSFFLLLGSIVCSALATVPTTVHRADPRTPDQIKAAGGFAGFGTNMDITLIEHVTRQYDSAKKHRQGQDPWVSTSQLDTIGCQNTVSKPCWVYNIDTTGISSGFKSVAEEFAAANKQNGNKQEEEWATNGKIPLSAIKSFYKMNDKLQKTKPYTWETWEAKKKTTAASGSTASSSKKTSRDETTMAKKDGILVPVAFQA